MLNLNMCLFERNIEAKIGDHTECQSANETCKRGKVDDSRRMTGRHIFAESKQKHL